MKKNGLFLKIVKIAFLSVLRHFYQVKGTKYKAISSYAIKQKVKCFVKKLLTKFTFFVLITLLGKSIKLLYLCYVDRDKRFFQRNR
jgi:predicted cation transporter